MSNNTPEDSRMEPKDETLISHIESPIESTIDEKERKKLKLKLDLFVLPLISSVYFFGSMVDENSQQYRSVFQRLILCD